MCCKQKNNDAQKMSTYKHLLYMNTVVRFSTFLDENNE